jgi:hypothetical protein
MCCKGEVEGAQPQQQVPQLLRHGGFKQVVLLAVHMLPMFEHESILAQLGFAVHTVWLLPPAIAVPAGAHMPSATHPDQTQAQ